MAPKKRRHSPTPDPNGLFHGMIVFLVPKGIQQRRLQVWKQKLEQMGATIEDHLSKRVTHVFAADSKALLQQLNRKQLELFKGDLLLYQWLENCLKSGERLSVDQYILKLELEDVNNPGHHETCRHNKQATSRHLGDQSVCHRRTSVSSEGSEDRVDEEKTPELGEFSGPEGQDASMHAENEMPTDDRKPNQNTCSSDSPSSVDPDLAASEASEEVDTSQLPSLYKPPDLNRNITEIFGKLINIYRALGDDRRSFSYSKAIPVIEKLPFKIESADQVKQLPAIGKSMQDHVL